MFPFLWLVHVSLTFICCFGFCHLATLDLRFRCAHINHLITKLEGNLKGLTNIYMGFPRNFLQQRWMSLCHRNFYFYLKMKNWRTEKLNDEKCSWNQNLTSGLRATSPLNSTPAHLFWKHIWPSNSAQRPEVYSC